MKKFLLILLGFLVLGGGIYYLSKKSNTVSQTNSAQVSPTSSVMPSNSVMQDWKTYDYPGTAHFSFKYPPSFYVYSDRGDKIFNDKQAMVDYLSGKITNNQIAITPLRLIENFNGDLQKLANRVAGGSQTNVPYTEVTFNNYTGVKLVYKSVLDYAFPARGGFVWIYIQPVNSSLIPQFEQMLSSLQIDK